MLALNVTLEGPFGRPVTETINPGTDDEVTPENNFLNYPQLRAVLYMDKDLFPIYLQASYEKKLIREFADLINEENATIQASLNFRMGPATISLAYRLRNESTLEPGVNWESTSILESFISLF
jgi:hypothetical protein